ncbi:hypothetical protein N431DRAFT_504325 [Stipitochalara longipes BDJ]|nr:hypothetical protein N431DRAFT_504325 [Stipitochalara longipes BDJ]
MSTAQLALAIVALFSCFGVNAQSNLNYSYVGGIPLRTPGKCPAGSVSGQITFQQNCCGADQTFVKVEGSACCPDSNDCYNEVVAAPKCADPSWQLCGTSGGGFCCEENWVCWTRSVVVSGVTGAGVGCSTPGATLAKGQAEVTTVYAANSGPGASTTSSPSAPSTSPSSLQATPTGKTDSGSQPSSTSVSLPTTESPGSQSTLTSSSPSYSSSSSSSTSNSGPGGNSQGSSSGSTPTTKKSSSLGGGAIAGIAVGALALLAAAFVGGVWLTRRRNKTDPSGTPMLEDFKTSLTASNKGIAAAGGSELQAHAAELGTKVAYAPMSELPTYQQQLVEMYAPHKTT